MQFRRTILMLGAYLFVLLLQSCVSGMQLSPRSADPTELKGTYTLITYGCRYADDVENIAILSDEKSGYSVEVYALDAMYKVRTGLPGDIAMSEAKAFIHCGMHTVWQTVFRKISDSKGTTIAYELKPLFEPWEFKTPEVLLSSYVLNGSIVTAYFQLDPSLKRENGPMDRSNKLRGY